MHIKRQDEGQLFLSGEWFVTLLASMAEIASVYNTDKNSVHSYVSEMYENLFRDLRLTVKNVLEIGVHCGGSLCMWRDYFPHAVIYGVDVNDCKQLRCQQRIVHLVANAYCDETLKCLPKGFDVVIDDGDHTLESMIYVVQRYTQKIVCGGLLVIEDIQDVSWCDRLYDVLPTGCVMNTYDMRHVKGRNDDVAVVVQTPGVMV